MMSDENLKVLIVTGEMVPFAKTGGLADVAGSLPKALAALGNDVRVVMPRYKGIDWNRTVIDFPVTMGGRKQTCIVRESSVEAKLPDGGLKEVPVYFIDNYNYFDRDGIYGFWDEAERYAFFCKAVVEMLPRMGWQPNIVHCNDWQTAPIPVLIKEKNKQTEFYQKTGTLLTVHNLLYQGNFGREVLELLDLGEEYYHPERMEFFGEVSYIKAGLVYADIINTVSSTYAHEIQTPEFGEGMEGLLRKRAHDLYGIVNGINYHEFNPKTDPQIFRNYDAAIIEEKKENKYALQKELGLPVEDVPLLGLVHRLVEQKGIDLLEDILDSLMSERIQLAVLGIGEPSYQEMFKGYQQKYQEKMAVVTDFNSILAQRIYAGSDMFLMPSKFEPCGLGQLIALRYGSIPIVRSTGGLADTIINYDADKGIGNGFAFKEYSSEGLYHAIIDAVRLYFEEPVKWAKLIETGMAQDFSWNRSATEYLDLYDKALSKVLGGLRSA